MAGTAILAAREKCSRLRVVTLTINNTCNLQCPHCYLQYAKPDMVLGAPAVGHIFASPFDRLCIVGKEPLANSASIDAVELLVERTAERGTAASLISNGLNADLLSDRTLQSLEWMDVSLDGGEQTYSKYRRGSWSKLRRSIDSIQARGLRELRVLNTLSEQTVGALGDMVAGAHALGASTIMFSPFQPTRSQGSQFTAALPPRAVVDALAPYAGDNKVFLSLDVGYLGQFADAAGALADARSMLGDRFIYVESDPIDRGFIRVTFDGLVMTPLQAVHTSEYPQENHLLHRPLEEWYGVLSRTHAGSSRPH
jgi:MoaA/NifB/PqqE/SkfB family radical SAM enzyme